MIFRYSADIIWGEQNDSEARCDAMLLKFLYNSRALVRLFMKDDGLEVSMNTYFNGREIFLIDGLPENTSRDSVETMGNGTGKWQAR
jgi:hypothetical protein